MVLFTNNIYFPKLLEAKPFVLILSALQICLPSSGTANMVATVVVLRYRKWLKDRDWSWVLGLQGISIMEGKRCPYETPVSSREHGCCKNSGTGPCQFGSLCCHDIALVHAAPFGMSPSEAPARVGAISAPCLRACRTVS